MNALDLPKPQQDFMRQVRNELQVHVQSPAENQGNAPWVAIEDRGVELGTMQEFFLTSKVARARIYDAIDMRLQIDAEETALFKMLAETLRKNNPEKEDNIGVASLKISYDENGTGAIQGIPIPPHQVLRKEFREYFGLQSPDIRDPRVEQVLHAHRQIIAKSPAEGFGAMTNWLSRFPDYVFMVDGYGKEDPKKLSKQPMSRTHPWLFPEARMSSTARYMPSMYISAAIDNTSKADKQSIIMGIEQSRKIWSNFWKSVMETQEA